MCDLDMTEDRSCVLRSPFITDTSNSTCMAVSYHLSSSDVQMTLGLLENDVPQSIYTLLPNETVKQVSWMGDVVDLQLTASRYLNSTENHAYALLCSVEFLPCSSEPGVYIHTNEEQNTVCRRMTSIWGDLIHSPPFELATFRTYSCDLFRMGGQLTLTASAL